MNRLLPPTAMVGIAWFLAAAAAPGALHAQTADTATAYVASSQGQVYFWIGCDAWQQLKPENLRRFTTRATAEAAGYRPSRSRGCGGPPGGGAITATIGGSATCRIARVIDGDTFECDGGERIRLLLIDTPELDQGPYGAAARDTAALLLPAGDSVRLEFDVQVRDPYERLLAYAYVDSLLVNRALVRRGMAVVSVYPPNVRLVELLRAAADSARAEGAGLWSGSAFECLPADYRAGRCR
ncbi:MAG: thermonuclease family protein [Gemmatimonadota bacterium]